jgi:L-ascorbate metabolism protein UlaG (beta-lactamase superfamily)
VIIKGFTIGHLSHASFLFRSPEGTVILTDPLFAKGFIWDGHFESYLTPPHISVEEITRCDAIFVSHIHGDHYDPKAVQNIHLRTRARIFAPDDVLESLQAIGILENYLVHIEDGIEIKINDVGLIPLSGYDNSFDEKGRPNKFSIMMKTSTTSLFYSGDCHETPPGLKGKRVDALFFWPHRDDEKLVRFCKNVDFSKLILMHGDRFEPGDFLCNLDYSEQKNRIQRLLPNVEIIVPERTTEIERVLGSI